MTTAFLRVDQLPALSVVPDDALVAVWSAGRLWAAPRSAVGTGGGGGGGGYVTVEANGTPLTQRDTINVTGLLQASDSGGETILTLPNINLASQVTGVLPIANGGTGLSALGAPGTQPRVNALGTALEYVTVGAGLNAPANPGDNNKAAVASGGNLVYSFLTTANLSPTAGILLTQLQNISADRLLGADSAGAPAQLTVGGNLEFTGAGGIQRGALTGVVTAAAGSGVTAVSDDSIGASKFVDRPADGGNLTNGAVTKTIADGSRFKLPAGTLGGGGTKSMTMDDAGMTTADDDTVEVVVEAQSLDYLIVNGGPAGGTIYTVLAGQERVHHIIWNGFDWTKGGTIRKQ